MANLKNAKHAKIETREPGIVARAGMAALMASTVATPAIGAATAFADEVKTQPAEG